ncbi:MAG: hypothetical protein WB755_18770, partial [Terriglobales bacterium]
MPLVLAEAICGSEAGPADAVLLVFVFAGAIEPDAIELEGAAVELAGAAAGAAAGAGAGLEAGAAAVVPESVSDFLLLRVFLVGAAVVSVLAAVAGAAVAGAAAGAVA